MKWSGSLMQQCICLSLEGKSISSCWFASLLLNLLCFLKNSAVGANMLSTAFRKYHFDPFRKMASWLHRHSSWVDLFLCYYKMILLNK